MISPVVNLLIIAFITFLAMVIAGRKLVFRDWPILVIFFGLIFLDNILIITANQFPVLQLIPNHIWGGFLVCSWAGKLYSLIATLGMVLFLLLSKTFSRQELGLIAKQAHGSASQAIAIVAGISLMLASWGLGMQKDDFDVQTLSYLTIMPALNEELVYRGLLLGFLNRIFPRKWEFLRASIGWGIIIITLLFALLHSIWLDYGLHLNIGIIPLLSAATSGFIFGWLRERTGSLIFPILAHSAWNFFFFLPRMMKV